MQGGFIKNSENLDRLWYPLYDTRSVGRIFLPFYAAPFLLNPKMLQFAHIYLL